MDNGVAILHWVYWIYDQVPLLHRLKCTQNWGGSLICAMKKLKKQMVCRLVRTDEVQDKVMFGSFELTRKVTCQINELFTMILYVQHNEETTCLKIVHFHEETVPSEIEANTKSM